MNWEQASNLIWNRFCELDDTKQIEVAEKSFADTVFIFPTSKFSEFCKDTLKGDFKEVAIAVATGTSEDDFDFHYPWCLYHPILKRFSTDESPASFVEEPDTLIENIANNDESLAKLGFSKEEIKEIVDAYISCEDED